MNVVSSMLAGGSSPKVYELIAGPLSADVISVRGREALSELFAFDVHVAAHLDSPLFETAVLGLPAQLTMNLPQSKSRVVQGVVSRVRRVSTKLVVPPGSDQAVYGYRLRIVPRMWMLTRRVNTRIFQDLSVPDIVAKVLGEHGVAYRKALAGTYVTRGYCVQYRESDYRFVTRLLAEEGILHYFDPPTSLLGGGTGAAVASVLGSAVAAAGLGGLALTETVVLGDGPSAYQAVGADPLAASASGAASMGASVAIGVSVSLAGSPTLVFRNVGGLAATKDEVRDFELERAVQSRAVLLRDYDFQRPQLEVAGKASVSDALSVSVSLSGGASPSGGAVGLSIAATAAGSLDPVSALAGVSATDLGQVYEHHGDYEVPDFDARRAGVVLEQERRRAVRGGGVSFFTQMSVGHTFVLDEHPSDALNRPYVLCEVEHRGHVPDRSGSKHADRPVYENRFRCSFAEVTQRPQRPRRRTRQPMETATVVGPPSEEIFTDALGRIKVQFHWDLEGKNDAHSSCWIRVSQAWAGAGWGFQFIPRVGMEVIVGFVGGDPDRPMVLGCVNNGTHPTSYPLPVRKTRSGIRSQSSPDGGGWNEIAFEDETGQEDLVLHAHKDMTEEVGHDRDVTVGNDLVEEVRHDKRLTVGGARSDMITQDLQVTVGSDHVTAVAGKQSTSVTGSSSTTVGQDASARVGGDQSLQVGGDRSVVVQGDAKEQIHGDRATYVFGEEARTVWQDARLSFAQACGVTVSTDLAITVGSTTAPGTARMNVAGDTTSQVLGKSELTIAKSLVIRVGDKNKITIDDDGVKIESSAINLIADSITATSSKGALQLDDNAQLSAKVVTAFSTDGGILELTASAQLDGTAVKINCQNSAQQSTSQQKKDQSQDLDKLSVTLFDRTGKAIDGAPYEVSCQGYLDDGTASGGIVQIPKFPGVEKCQIRWARLMADRQAELGDSSEELPTFEFEMDVFLAFDASDAQENVLRKLHNLGHQGTPDQAVLSYYAAKGITGGPMSLDDIQGEVGSRHDAQQPIELTTGDST